MNSPILSAEEAFEARQADMSAWKLRLAEIQATQAAADALRPAPVARAHRTAAELATLNEAYLARPRLVVENEGGE